MLGDCPGGARNRKIFCENLTKIKRRCHERDYTPTFCFREMMKIKHQPVAPSGQLLCVNLTHPPLPVPPAQGEVGLGAGAAEEGVV